jgi:hypothetical protein
MLIYALFSETAQVLDLNLTGETADENKRAFFNRIQRKNSGRKKRVGQSDMYPLYWTSSKEGILCDIVMRSKENALKCIVIRGSIQRRQKVSKPKLFRSM